ncbi:MAG: hydroxyacid dehydrogenase [Betaproteobacteria bacterium HGW-Betaproteobacteria-11]|nr:MAG: hydroxyacid dehydrogenase [Betaproteobacteria bacterium HGW-Betaproteobacteria-11]
MSGLLDSLCRITSADFLLTADADVAPYCTDWRGRYSGRPLAVALPADTAAVAAIVGVCAAAEVAIVPQGGNTGLVGGATPRGGEVLLSLKRLNRIRTLDSDNLTLIAEAGCTLQAVQDAAAGIDRLFPLSLAAEGSATLGGNLSTNAGGVQVLRYGTARELTLGLEVVLPDGRVWDGLRTLRKDNTGYDLKQLFIGAEGTLGLITAASVKLFPRPRQNVTLWLAVPDPLAAVRLLGVLRAAVGDAITAFELIDRNALALVLEHIPGARNPLPEAHAWQVLVELSLFEATAMEGLLERLMPLLASSGVLASVLATSEAQRRAFWALRENISLAQKTEGVSIKHDIALPISAIAEFIAAAGAALHAAFPGIRIVCFGHLGDGNLHYNLSQADAAANPKFIARTAEANRLVHDRVHRLGGSISAEHGLGQLKRDEVLRYKSEVEIDLMRRVKRALDPQGIMNPGKVL